MSALKVRTNEFVALDIVPLLETIKKTIQGVEQSLLISSKNWETLSSFPANIYLSDSSDEICKFYQNL